MRRPETFRIQVLGCRVNHAERRELASVLRGRGLEEVAPGHEADLEIVHTCSVTARAAAKSRQASRRVRRNRQREPIVLLTGCFVGTDRELAKSLAGETGEVFGHEQPMPQAVGDWLDTSFPRSTPQSAPKTDTPTRLVSLPLAARPDQPSKHVRAEVRIQDGCDAHCTFCIIPTTRPQLRTKSIQTVLDEVQALVELGHREVVLAGIFLGAYGHETALRRKQHYPQAEALAELVHAVATVPGLARVRLSSLEPGDVSDALIDTFCEHDEVVVPHLHLPLQSGSDAILRRMNRQYRVGEYLDMIDRLTEALSRGPIPPAITTDIICGFPGETDADFEQTIEVARRVGYLHMHVFPYSARPGTAAARWRDRAIPPAVSAARVRRLIEMETLPETGLAAIYRRTLLGSTTRLLIEQPDPRRPGHWLGRCDHYALVSVQGQYQRGEIVRAIVGGIDDDALLASPVPVDTPLPVLPTGLMPPG